jgi:hypothetical protein
MTEGHGRIVGVFGGCHRAPGAVGAAITAFTTAVHRWFKPMGVSTHSSVGFLYEDGYREIFEAREGKSWQGPIPVSKVHAWVAREPSKRRFTMYDIPTCLIDESMAVMRWNLCRRQLHVWTYSIKQLPRMGLRKWMRFLPINTTHNQVVCSEAATIILDPPCPILRIAGVRVPDLVTPYLFEKAMKEICAEPGHAPTDASSAYED